ncbi:MAG: retropepsin-like aspartic protease [Bacteroidota bacterium]
MKNLSQILKKEKYRKIKFKVTKTQHLLLKVEINGVKGNFILDTGASNTCIGLSNADYFNLVPTKSKTKAAGAGATGMLTHIAKHSSIKMGSWKNADCDIVLFDLSHVNEALVAHKEKSVHGIIGADILLMGKAIIDYPNEDLYLMK